MSTLSAAELLNVWEIGASQHPVQRGLTLLALALSEPPLSSLANLSIGRRDAALLTLRERLFGTRLNSIAPCPHCGERLELSFGIDEIRAPLPAEPNQLLQVQNDEYDVQFRLPTSADLLAITDIEDPATAPQQLLQRCVTNAQTGSKGDAEYDFTVLPEAVIGQILAQMADADPQGDVQLALVCPSCTHQWLMTFDILSYLWDEIDHWAQRTLQDVHQLAAAYGWREADILALSAQRRQLYLDMIGK